jgi:hypothetical protein
MAECDFMAIFVIFHSANPASLKTAVETSFPNDHLALGSSEWLISAAMAPIEVSDKLVDRI